MMEIIKGRQVLNQIIREAIWESSDEMIYPKDFFFCDGIGKPTFKITIQKIEEDVFIDDSGCRWIKEKRKK